MTRRQTYSKRDESSQVRQPGLPGHAAQAGLRDERSNGGILTEISVRSCSTFAGPANYRAAGNSLRRVRSNNNIEQEFEP